MEGSPAWQLDWLTLNPGVRDRKGVQWFLSDCTGFWDGPPPRTQLVERVNTHGALIGPSYKKERTITLKGRAFAPDFPTLRDAQARLAGICADPTQLYPLTCYAETGTVTCNVVLDGDVIANPLAVMPPAIEWSLQLVAPDPRKYSATSYTATVQLPWDSSGTGLDFEQAAVAPDTGAGLSFGTVTDPTTGLLFGTGENAGTARLTNRGTAPASPVYTLYGPLTTPVLTTATTGTPATMQYNATLNAGDVLVIDPSAPSVLLGGTASRRYLLNPANFSGFVVPPATTTGPGVLNVGLTHSGPATAGGWLEVEYRDAWW